MAKETLYDVLGVKPNVTPKELKSAWRILTRKHHSDTGDGDREALEKIQKAYKVLSDEDKRKKYNAVSKILIEKPKRDPDSFWAGINLSGNVVFTNNSVYYRNSGSVGPVGVVVNHNQTINVNFGGFNSVTVNSILIKTITRNSPASWGGLQRQSVTLELETSVQIAQKIYGSGLNTVSLMGSNGKMGNLQLNSKITDIMPDAGGTWLVKKININQGVWTQDATIELESI